MKVTKQRKIILVLLGIGVCALAGDRLTARSENVPSAANSSSLAVQTPAITTSAPVLPALTPATATPLSDRIHSAVARMPRGTALRDMFRVAPAWGSAHGNPARPEGAWGLTSFQQSHRMTALMVDGRRSSVIVDGNPVTLGQSIDGYRLVTVTQDMAVFESAGGRAILRIEEGTRAVSLAGD